MRKRKIACLIVAAVCLFLTGCGAEQPRALSDKTTGNHTCKIEIDCTNILENRDKLKPEKAEFLPEDGRVIPEEEVSFTPGESAFDVLKRVCREKKIHMASRHTPLYDSYYVEGINQIYEFDCGEHSGWMYCVNNEFPDYGCSEYEVKDGDRLSWVYTCSLGMDVGNPVPEGETDE